MKKENIYVSLLNTLIGMVITKLLSGSLLLYVLACIFVGTIIFIERRFIYEKIFRQKKWPVAAGGIALAVAMVLLFFPLTKTARDTASIVKTIQGFLDHVELQEYDQAYALLSQVCKKTYSLGDFVRDHRRLNIKVHDFRVDGVVFNEFDNKKALATVSSPFSIYGQSTLPMELVKEESQWKLVLSQKIVAQQSSPPRLEAQKKKKQGFLNRFFKKVF